MSSQRVLITGVTGFTGFYMAAEMASAGWEVYGTGGGPANSPHYTEVDLSNKAALSALIAEVRPHAVIHLAGLAFVGHGDADEFYGVNLLGARNLLQALASSGETALRCVLLASSANVYGNSTGGEIAEDRAPDPANDYAVSKLAMEYMAKLWMNRLPIVIARPFNYTGIGQTESFLLPKIVGHFRRQANSIELGNLDVCRDFSDVRSVVEAYRRLIERAPVGQVVNVCSGHVHSLRDVLSMVGDLAGYAIDVKINPDFVRANEVRVLCGSADRLRNLIGPWNTPPLRDTLQWMFRAPAA